MEPILPVLDMEALQKKANEFAMKGAEDALKEFYTGYNSPYKKALEAALINKGVDDSIDIPDIVGTLNESISKEVDEIANLAVAKTFLPLVKRFLTRADGEIKFSDLLKEFISYTDYDFNTEFDWEDYNVREEKNDGSFMYLEISNSKIKFELHFYQKDSKQKNVYEIYVLPYIKEGGDKHGSRSFSQRTMKLTVDGGTALEIPFTPGVLEDNFMSYIAGLIINNTKITFDTDSFSEDMFPERSNCHC